MTTAELNEQRIKEQFEEFVSKNCIEDLGNVVNLGLPAFQINFCELDRFDPNLTDFLIENPKYGIELFEKAVKNIEIAEDCEFSIRFLNFPEDRILKIRDIRSRHIGRFIAIDGLIRQASDVRPVATLAVYECPACGTQIEIVQNEQVMKEPSMCSCGRKGRFKMIEKKLVDTQRIVIEESTERIGGDAQPRRLSCFLTNDLVEPKIEKKTSPGTHVCVIGIVREIPILERGGTKTTRFDLMLEANNIYTTEHEYEELDISQEEIKEIKTLASSPEVYSKLVNSIAPSIYGYEGIKESIAIQMFGGVKTPRPDHTSVRGDIHILLVGDPGVAKSQLLKYVSAISPKARYVSGKGASGAGITASVVKDEFLRGWALEAGALVLANKGICCIDEIDKMEKEDRVAMHEAMEQQCLHYDTMITFADGSETKIGEFVETLMAKYKERVTPGVNCFILDTRNMDFEMLTTDWKKIFKTKIDRVSKHTATKKFVDLKIGNGRSITATPEHPVFVLRNDEIATERADRIKVGDWMPVPLNLPINGEEQIFLPAKIFNKKAKQHIKVPVHNGAEIFEIAGYILSEGSVEKNRFRDIGINFTNKDERLLSHFEKNMHSLFGLKPYKQAKIDSHEIRWMLRYVSTELTRFFEEYLKGILNKSGSKEVPNILMKGRKEDISRMLSCMFEGDGYVSKKTRTIRVGYRTKSRRLAEQVQDLLLRFGIRSSINSEVSMYRVAITGYNNLQKFNKHIRFVTEEKNETVAEYLTGKSEHKRTVKDVAPVSKIVLNLLEKYGIKSIGNYKYASILFDHTKKGYSFSREFLKKICTILKDRITSEDRDKLEFLKNLSDGEIGWEKVVQAEVVENKNQNWTYDMTIEPNHAFVSQNMILHNTITISKANIHSTLKSETTILAAANPKLGRFDPYQPIGAQIDMPATLLSRFDLIFAIRDLPEKDKDSKLASHILEAFRKPEDLVPEISPDLMRKYIAYAKRHCHPKLTSEAITELKDFFVGLRSQRSGDMDEKIQPIPLTARQLEAMVRLSQASAKIRLSDYITRKDAQRAINLMKNYLQGLGMDTETGQLDIDRIVTGITSSQRNKIITIKELIRELESKYGSNIPLSDLTDAAKEKGIEEAKMEEIIDRMKRDGELFEPKHGIIRRMPK